MFNVRDGSLLRGPAVYPLATFEARLSGNDVELRSVPPAP
jgi:nitrite reductase/ring-hydroxylating ferredoxin subunit